ncbi:MAG TPA: hypothetical protein VHU41_07545 [Thermoanaerobaculia bacterium]|jgi:hypothetical protein|nr:hypothetical protein [Thermoanaerobaculia bacterium]
MSSSAPTPPPPPATGGGGDLVYPQQPPKDPTIILVLNLLLLGGVGYIVMGQKMKGIVAIIVCLVIAIPTCGVGSLLVGVAAGIDGMMQAQQLQAGFPVGQWTFFKDHK